MKDKAAAVCVMDVYNGHRFFGFFSNFEPNEFVHGLDKAYWNSLIKNEKPLANTLSGLYPRDLR